MAWLRKTRGTPGSAEGGLVWNTPEDVVEVTDEELATQLLAIPAGGFETVPAPEHDKTPTGTKDSKPDETETAKSPEADAGAANTATQEQLADGDNADKDAQGAGAAGKSTAGKSGGKGAQPGKSAG